MMSSPSGMTVSTRTLIMLTDLLRAHRTGKGTRWQRLTPGRQALLVVAHLRRVSQISRAGHPGRRRVIVPGRRTPYRR